MEKLHFSVLIDAPREKVWQVLWNDDSYSEWTSFFSEGSRVKTDWKKGSKVLFLGATDEGMVSMIEDIIPNEFMSFKHLGMVNNGVEDISSDKVKEWGGAMENYTLKNVNGKTELTVDMDITDEHKDHFQEIFPKAFNKVKELAEKQKVEATSNV
jgi:uncharacterized protein YndB with AHSA1/START domain